MDSEPVKIVRTDQNSLVVCTKSGRMFLINELQKDCPLTCDVEADSIRDAIFASGKVILLSETNNLIILKPIDI